MPLELLYLFVDFKSKCYLGFELLRWCSLDRERILEYRDESQRLDQCSRLYDSSVSNDGFELDASLIVQVFYCFD